MTLYGFYSASAAQTFGSAIYTTPDGREVNVTLPTPHASSLEEVSQVYFWQDTVFLGEICKCVQKNFKNAYYTRSAPPAPVAPAPVDCAPLIRLVVDAVLPEEEDLPAFYADAHHQRQDERRKIRRELLAVADNHQAVCGALADQEQADD